MQFRFLYLKTIYNAILFEGLSLILEEKPSLGTRFNRAIIDRLACFERDNGFNGPCSVYVTLRLSGLISVWFGFHCTLLSSGRNETMESSTKIFDFVGKA